MKLLVVVKIINNAFPEKCFCGYNKQVNCNTRESIKLQFLKSILNVSDHITKMNKMNFIAPVKSAI